MTDDLVLKLDGEGVKPGTIPLVDLAYILDQLAKAVKSVAEASGLEGGALDLSLVEVTDGSGKFSLAASAPATRHVRKIVAAINSRDGSLLPFPARQNVSAIHGRTRSRGWDLELYSKNRSKEAAFRAVVKPNTQLFDTPRITGGTSIVATVNRAGGVLNCRAELQLADGTTINAKVNSKELTEKLGTLLYKTVELNGIAVWNSENLTLHSFKVTSLGDYSLETSDPSTALVQLRGVSELWESVNVAPFLSDLRQGGSEVVE
jgi:hypothetical protein